MLSLYLRTNIANTPRKLFYKAPSFASVMPKIKINVLYLSIFYIIIIFVKVLNNWYTHLLTNKNRFKDNYKSISQSIYSFLTSGKTLYLTTCLSNSITINKHILWAVISFNLIYTANEIIEIQSWKPQHHNWFH